MKGEALITIKDKNGNIKKQVKEKNVVFDIPKELMKFLIKGANFPGGKNTLPTSSSTEVNPVPLYTLSYIQSYEDFFKAIKINDEECDTTDYKDFKVPVLFGSEADQLQTTNTRYAKYDSNNSSKNDNVLKKVYTWNNCPAFTLKSINMCHFNIMNPFVNKAIESQSGKLLTKYGKFYISKDFYSTTKAFNRNYNTLYQLSNKFSWDNNRMGFDTENIIQVCSNQGSYYYRDQIFTAKDREIILLKSTDGLTSDTDNYGPRYVVIIDADTGAVKRSFPITQFTGVVNPSYYQSTNARVFTTAFGNFLMIETKQSTPYKINIYKIPDQSEMANYSNNEPIAIWYEDVSTNLLQNTNAGAALQGCSIINQVAIFTRDNNYNYWKTIKINSATPGDVTLYNYAPVNTSNISTSDYQHAGKHATIYLDDYLFQDGIPTWFNTTALNLSGGGVSVSEGDTLTIEYTITAN